MASANVQGKYSKVKVFSATKAQDRENLGGHIGDWITRFAPNIVETVVTQSSDAEFHCLAITIFYNEK